MDNVEGIVTASTLLEAFIAVVIFKIITVEPIAVINACNVVPPYQTLFAVSEI